MKKMSITYGYCQSEEERLRRRLLLPRHANVDRSTVTPQLQPLLPQRPRYGNSYSYGYRDSYAHSDGNSNRFSYGYSQTDTDAKISSRRR